MNFTMTKTCLRPLAALAVLWASAGALKAQTVSWGGSLSSAAPLSYLSNGAVDTNLVWTLGWFDNFTPTATNFADWQSHYMPTAETSNQRFEGGTWTVQHNTENVGEEAAGQEMYVFAYNSLGLIGQPGGEALLYRQVGLKFPAEPNQVTFDIADGVSSLDNNFEVVWGRVDRNMQVAGGIVTGGGTFSSLVADSATGTGNPGVFESQAATWAVPETSSGLLGLLGSALLLSRRGRSQPVSGV